MTYNFDPERWYENERAFLDHRYRSGEISARKYRDTLNALEKRLGEMWTRLDGSYRMPGKDEDGPVRC